MPSHRECRPRKWIAEENSQAALEVVARIEAAAEAIGFMATGRKGRVTGTYEKPVAGLPWIIAYAIETRVNGRERIAIVRVIHSQARLAEAKMAGQMIATITAWRTSAIHVSTE
jgi:toxin ParE1/3/4